jgi:hypothetical protein
MDVTASEVAPSARSAVEVVLLDGDGVIVAVNEAWSRFSDENGGDPCRTGVGASYLAACDAARDRESGAVAAAIRAAAAGGLPAPLSIRIPCPAPGRPRFFDVLVLPRLDPSGETRGAMVTLSPTDGPRSPDESQVRPGADAALAGSAGVVVDKARLRAEVVRQRRWLDASTAMTRQLFAGDSPYALEVVLRHAGEGADAEYAAAVIPSDQGRARVQTVLRNGGRRPDSEVELGSTLAGQVVRTGRPALASDDVGPRAGAPLTSADETVWAALVVGRSHDAAPFTEHDLTSLAAYAGHAGIAMALERARTEREKVLLMADHERIAADLNSHVIQELFATGMGLQGLVARQALPEDRLRVLALVDAIDATIRHIRSTIFEVRTGD